MENEELVPLKAKIVSIYQKAAVQQQENQDVDIPERCTGLGGDHAEGGANLCLPSEHQFLSQLPLVIPTLEMQRLSNSPLAKAI